MAVPMFAGVTLAVLPATSGARLTASPWVNHDTDSWGGWSDRANPGFATNPQGCDPIDPAQCMLPYPNDWLTRPDPTSATGRRLALNVLAMPRNIAGKPVDPTAWNDSDGFSAGSTMLTFVPGMTKNADLQASALPTDTNMALNTASGLGVLLLDTTTGDSVPVWVEIDQYTTEAGVIPAGTTSPVQQDLMIHPAVNLIDGHRYIVALRHLVTDNGSLASPSAAFRSYVHAFVSGAPLGSGIGSATDPRTGHMDGVFQDLEEAGWQVTSDPSDLYLAWDFTTASSQNVTGRLLAIRDNAFEQLGETKAQIDAGKDVGKAPKFTVSSVTSYSASQNANVAEEITGTFTVPCYIQPTCSPPVKCAQSASLVQSALETFAAKVGEPVQSILDQLAGNVSSPVDDCPSPGTFYYKDPLNPDATPSQVPGQTYKAGYICEVGRTAFEAGQAMRPVEYGHGLFGSDSEVRSSPQEEMANREGMLYCATDWFGFANADVPNAVLALADLSNFPLLGDRPQQGELNFLYLQRLLANPKGFASNPAFEYPNGTSFINLADGVYYDGNSQGGIYGGTVCAVSIDVRRCALGVPGMDYSTLLPRSVDYVANESLTQVIAQNATNPGNISNAIGYSNLLDFFYPDQAQRQLVLDLIQTLWDRGDPDGYASHMTYASVGGPLLDCTGQGVVKVSQVNGVCPVGTPDHHVLMQIAWGDHQVANITALDEARTIGAFSVGTSTSSNAIGGGEAVLASRLCNVDAAGNTTLNDSVDGAYCWNASSVLWGIEPITSYPFDGSAIEIWDAGPDG
ncbi:MAG: hypothetical protein ACYDD4_07890, partial [Acidimicrobiales bacterium]